MTQIHAENWSQVTVIRLSRSSESRCFQETVTSAPSDPPRRVDLRLYRLDRSFPDPTRSYSNTPISHYTALTSSTLFLHSSGNLCSDPAGDAANLDGRHRPGTWQTIDLSTAPEGLIPGRAAPLPSAAAAAAAAAAPAPAPAAGWCGYDRCSPAPRRPAGPRSGPLRHPTPTQRRRRPTSRASDAPSPVDGWGGGGGTCLCLGEVPWRVRSVCEPIHKCGEVDRVFSQARTEPGAATAGGVGTYGVTAHRAPYAVSPHQHGGTSTGGTSSNAAAARLTTAVRFTVGALSAVWCDDMPRAAGISIVGATSA